MTYLSSQQVIQSDTGTIAHVSHFGVLKAAPTLPVVKANFPGSALDTTLWTETTANGGDTTVADGQAILSTNTTANGSVKLISVNTGIFEAGQVTVYQSGVRAGVGVANNTRRWGLITQDELDGLFFEWDGTTFNVVARKNGTDTQVDSASFNREPGWEPTNNNNTFRIQYSAGRALFQRSLSGNIKTLHVMTDSQSPLVNDLDLALYYENTNTSGSTTDVDLVVRGASSSIFGSLPTSRANENITDSSVSQLTKSILTGRDFNGVYHNIDSNENGALVTTPFLEEVAKGIVPGYSTRIIVGRNPGIDIGTAPEDIWAGGGLYMGHPTTAPETVTVLSSSALDTLAGTGLQTIRITGLLTSTSTDFTTEDINMNGILGAVSSNTWYRVIFAKGLTYGTGGTNAGSITIRHTVTVVDVFISFPPGFGCGQLGAITVPQGKQMFIEAIYVAIVRNNGSNGSALFTLRTKPNTETWDGNAIAAYNLSTQSAINPPLKFPIIIEENTDLVGRIDSVSDNGTQASITLDCVFIDT